MVSAAGGTAKPLAIRVPCASSAMLFLESRAAILLGLQHLSQGIPLLARPGCGWKGRKALRDEVELRQRPVEPLHRTIVSVRVLALEPGEPQIGFRVVR